MSGLGVVNIVSRWFPQEKLFINVSDDVDRRFSIVISDTDLTIFDIQKCYIPC